MRKLAILLPLIALLYPVGLAVQANVPSVQLFPASVVEYPCQEDEPCWDCNTMGNKICGPSDEDLQEHADAAWEGLTSEQQRFLLSIGASDQEVIDFRNSLLKKLPRTN